MPIPGALTLEEGVARHMAFLEKAKRRIIREREAKAAAKVRATKTRMAENLAAEGRGSDTEVAHVTPGEMVIPRVFQTPEVMAAIAKVAAAHGVPLDRFRVGDVHNSVNRKTGAPEFIFDDTWQGTSPLLSIVNAETIARSPMLSGNPLSSVTSGFDRWASTPINIDYTDAGLFGVGANAPYRYNGPQIEEITVTAPRATNPPYSGGPMVQVGGNIPYNGDLALPGGDTVSGNVARTQEERNRLMLGGALRNIPAGPIGMAGGAAGGYLDALKNWTDRVWKHHEWDYKDKPPYEDFGGNYNCGATGAQLLPEWALQRGAGVAQMLFGPRDPSNGTPFGGRPYGNQVEDVDAIAKGFDYGQSRRW